MCFSFAAEPWPILGGFGLQFFESPSLPPETAIGVILPQQGGVDLPRSALLVPYWDAL